MGRRKKLPLLEKIEVIDLGAKGKAIAKVDDFVTFISGGLPGDVVDVQLTRKRKSWQEGRVVKVHTYSEKRSEPFCKHFGVCGGCKWQNLQYAEQLFYKQKEVTDTLTRVGGLTIPDVVLTTQGLIALDKNTGYINIYSLRE